MINLQKMNRWCFSPYRYYSTWTEQMQLKNENKSSTEPSTNKSRTSSKKKHQNGDSLRHELHGMIPELSSSNEGNNAEQNSTSSSTPSSDDESGVFDTRFH
jgi:hypothetical protein